MKQRTIKSEMYIEKNTDNARITTHILWRLKDEPAL